MQQHQNSTSDRVGSNFMDSDQTRIFCLQLYLSWFKRIFFPLPKVHIYFAMASELIYAHQLICILFKCTFFGSNNVLFIIDK